MNGDIHTQSHDPFLVYTADSLLIPPVRIFGNAAQSVHLNSHGRSSISDDNEVGMYLAQPHVLGIHGVTVIVAVIVSKTTTGLDRHAFVVGS